MGTMLHFTWHGELYAVNYDTDTLEIYEIIRYSGEHRAGVSLDPLDLPDVLGEKILNLLTFHDEN